MRLAFAAFAQCGSNRISSGRPPKHAAATLAAISGDVECAPGIVRTINSHERSACCMNSCSSSGNSRSSRDRSTVRHGRAVGRPDQHGHASFQIEQSRHRIAARTGGEVHPTEIAGAITDERRKMFRPPVTVISPRSPGRPGCRRARNTSTCTSCRQLMIAVPVRAGVTDRPGFHHASTSR